jgi:hypothetical protein
MKITIEIPDDIAQRLNETEGNLAHHLLELVVADAYCYGKINTADLKADLMILDDKSARRIAVERGLRIIGLLGIVRDAAKSNLLDLEITLEQLQNTGFRIAPSLLERLLTEN